MEVPNRFTKDVRRPFWSNTGAAKQTTTTRCLVSIFMCTTFLFGTPVNQSPSPRSVAAFYGSTRTVEVGTRAKKGSLDQPAGEHTDMQEKNRNQPEANEGLQHLSLELCREGEKEAPSRAGRKSGAASIGTLSCATLVYTEKSWRTEVSLDTRMRYAPPHHVG